MPNGTIIFRQISTCPADAVKAEQRDSALPNPGAKPQLPPVGHQPPPSVAPVPVQDAELTPPGRALGQSRGYIHNDAGAKCWYSQTTEQRTQYFQTLPNKTATLTFDNPRCMMPSELGLNANIMLINSVITRPYSHAGARFQTRVSDLFKTSLFQVRGQCIQSATYPIIGVLVEYHQANGSIYMVKHAPSAGRCSNLPVTKLE